MYQILFDGHPIYDPRGTDLGLIVRNPDCHLAVGEAGSLSFTIDPSHPYAQNLTKLKGVLELRADGVTIYKGRIYKDSRDFNMSRVIESEGLLACLNDSLIAPYDFPDDYLDDADYKTAAASGNVIKFFLEKLLAEHNSQVGQTQRIQLGTVTVTDPNNYISRASGEYLTGMETLKKKILEPLGGYLLADYSGETTVLHYYADLPLTNVQTVEFGENLLDLKSILDSAETYTAILPVGKDGLTIESLDDGEISPGYMKAGKIIYSKATEDLFGGLRITRRVDWKDVTVAANLRTKALAALSTEGIMLTQTIQVKAADLSGAADAVDQVAKFVVGRYVELKSTPHGFSASYPLMELEPDILDPGNTEIVLGATVKAASDLTNSHNNSVQESLGQINLILGQQEETVTELAGTTQKQITSAVQTAENIIFSALNEYVSTSDLDSYKSTVSSQLQILSEKISLEFFSTQETIQKVDGDTQRVVESLEKHFDFGLDGLVIRAGANSMTLTLDNDMILFKKNGEQFGWWDGVDFHTGNIVIAVNERAQFGAFAMVPRSNGSLSFLKVGE